MAHVANTSPRARRRENNTERILEAAMAAITQGGFSALSMNKLADAVDFTPGALYRYFDSKDALLGALVDRVLVEVGERTGAMLEGLGGSDPLVRVVASTRAYRDFALESPHKFGLLAMSMAQPEVLLTTPDVAAPVIASMVSTLSPVADALAVASANGVLDEGDPLERTLVVFAAVQGALQLRKQARVAPQLIDVDRLCRQGVRTLLLGWGAKAEAVDAAFEGVEARVRAEGGQS